MATRSLTNLLPIFSASTRRSRRSRTNGTRDFDIGALAEISDASFDALDPVVWPARVGQSEDTRFFADGGFFTPDRKARFVAPEVPALRSAPSNDYPFVLNTGRVRDQWHTMTRTGLSPRLGQHTPEPFVEVHPDDAAALELKDFARIATAHGEGIFKVALNDGQQRGSVFAPDPLERRNRFRRKGLRAGRAAHRPVFRAAGSEGDARLRNAGRVRLARLCTHAARPSRRRKGAGGRGSRSMAASAR